MTIFDRQRFRRSSLSAVGCSAALVFAAACKFPYPADVPWDANDSPADATQDGPRGPTFARAYGSVGEDFGAFVAASDDAIAFGGLGDGVDFGGGPRTGPSFVAMLGAAGQHVWSIGLRSPINDAVFDRFGNLYIVGEFDGMVSLAADAPTLTSAGRDLLVAKFDPTGRHLWSRGYGGAGAQVGQRIATTADDDIVVCGEFAGVTNLGGNTLPYRGVWDVFVARFSRSDGAPRWSLGFGGTNEDVCRGVVAWNNGTAAAFGAFFGNMTVNGAGLPVGGGFDIFAVGLEASGAVQWTRGLGGAGTDQVANATLAPEGDAVIVGTFADDLDFGPSVLHSQAATDGFVARVSSAGNVAWATAVSGPRLEDVKSAGVLDGDLVISGTFDGNATIGTVVVTAPPAHGADVFLARLRYGDGAAMAAMTFGGMGTDGIQADSVVAGGTVILTGGFTSPTIDFGVGLVSSPGDTRDAYLARVVP